MALFSKRMIDCTDEGNRYVDGLIFANEKAWRHDWMRQWRAGIYTPWPEFIMEKLDDLVMLECASVAAAGLPFKADFDFPEFDDNGGDGGKPCWVVREQLCPECRGWIPHCFKTLSQAREFYLSRP